MKRPRRWRALLRQLHRDLGYLAFGLTLVYGISGLAVNHMADWNPSLRFSQHPLRFEPIHDPDPSAQLKSLQRQLRLPEPRASVQPAEGEIQLFYEGYSILATPRLGEATRYTTTPRPVLARVNQLHLNHPKGWWTYAADVYALLLLFLAVSGLFMLRGPKGLLGRGKWFVGLGLLLPIVAWLSFP